MMELNTAMAKEKRYEKSEEPEEIDDTHTEQEKVEPKKKLETTRGQVCELDKARTTVKRPRSASDNHESPHTLPTSPIVQMKSPRMEMDVAAVEKRKYEVLREVEEIPLQTGIP